MTDTVTPVDRRTDLKAWIARLDQRIEVVKHDITDLQDDLDNFEIERATYLETRSENTLESMISPFHSFWCVSAHGNSFDEFDELEDEEDRTRNCI